MTRSPVASSTATTDPGLFTPAFIALLLAVLAYFTAGGMEIPLAPLFATRILGADEIGVGIAVGTVALTALFLRPIAGRASDRRGRRPLLVGGALLYAAATAAHAVAPNSTVMVGLRLVLGVAEAFFFVWIVTLWHLTYNLASASSAGRARPDSREACTSTRQETPEPAWLGRRLTTRRLYN